MKWYLSTLGGSKITLILGIRRDGRFDVFFNSNNAVGSFSKKRNTDTTQATVLPFSE